MFRDAARNFCLGARLVHSFLICLQLEAWLAQHRVPIPPTIVAR